MEIDNREEIERHSLIIMRKYVGPALVILIVSMVVYYNWVTHFYRNNNPNNSASSSALTDCGLFGDMFGAYSAFFAGLGFIAVAVTTYIQMKQAHRAKTEATFFNMLSRLGEIINNSYHPDTNDKGHVCLRKAMADLETLFNKEVLAFLYILAKNELPKTATSNDVNNFIINRKLTNQQYKDLVVAAYEKLYIIHEHNLGHYFRYLYNIIKYIKRNFDDSSNLALEYINLIQAQMSNDELGLLFYNAVSVHGRNLEGKHLFKKWLDECNFLENVDPRCIFDDSFLEFYPETSFKFKEREKYLAKEAADVLDGLP